MVTNRGKGKEIRKKGRWPLQIWKAAEYLFGLWPSNELNPIIHRRWLYHSDMQRQNNPLLAPLAAPQARGACDVST